MTHPAAEARSAAIACTQKWKWGERKTNVRVEVVLNGQDGGAYDTKNIYYPACLYTVRMAASSPASLASGCIRVRLGDTEI